MRDVSVWQSFWTVFVTVFLAELGDKTQLATLAFATEGKRLVVFAGAALALVLSAGLAVAAGSFLAERVRTEWVERGAGVLFLAVGAWTLWSSFRADGTPPG